MTQVPTSTTADVDARKDRGFTLIELLIVVVIIGILAAIAIPQYTTVRQRSFDAAARSDLRNLMTAQEIYFSINEAYTTSLTTLDVSGLQLSPEVNVTVVLTANGYRADASHGGSNDCFRVEVSPSTDGYITRVTGAGVGDGQCDG